MGQASSRRAAQASDPSQATAAVVGGNSGSGGRGRVIVTVVDGDGGGENNDDDNKNKVKPDAAGAGSSDASNNSSDESSGGFWRRRARNRTAETPSFFAQVPDQGFVSGTAVGSTASETPHSSTRGTSAASHGEAGGDTESAGAWEAEVEWGGRRIANQNFPDAFMHSMRGLALESWVRLVIVLRFVKMAYKYRHLRRLWQCVSTSSRFFVTFGSMVVPAMIVADDHINERPITSRALAYTTLSLSVLVSIVNAMHEMTSATRRFVLLHTTEELLYSEGWAFITLTGKYRRFERHDDCWQYFISRCDKIHMAAVNSSMSMTRRPTDDETGVPAADLRGHDAISGEGEARGWGEAYRRLVPPVAYSMH